jgi:membrane-bound serine protease (ClpP class)
MPLKFNIYLSHILILLGLLSVANHVHAQENTAFLLEINGTIDLGTANYIERGIKTAHQQHAPLIILQLNTSSGLDKYMRSIINTIEVSKIPIVAYVAPSGARAANAGTFILFASPIAAMAPGTHVGPASPMQNTTEDNIADIRNLAQRNDHNADWAALAVSAGASLTADAALTDKVINLIAENMDTLTKELNGSIVKLGEHKITLDTTAMTVTQLTPDIYSQFLSLITKPIAWLLLISLAIVTGLFFFKSGQRKISC